MNRDTQISMRVMSHDYGPADLTAHLTSIHVTTSISGGCQWSATIYLDAGDLPPKWRDSTSDERMADGDWVYIKTQRHMLVFGFIDAVRRARTALSDGRIETTYTLNGSGFERAFIRGELMMSPFLFAVDPPIPGLIRADSLSRFANLKVSGRIHPPHDSLLKTIRTIIEDKKTATETGIWSKAPEGAGVTGLYHAMHYAANVTEGKTFVRGGYMRSGKQTIDLQLKEAWHHGFTEWFYDLRSADMAIQPMKAYDAVNADRREIRGVGPEHTEVPTLIYRLVPFAKTEWEMLPMRELVMEEVSADDLGVNGAERYNAYTTSNNWYNTQQMQGVWEASGGRMPVFDRESIERYGLRWLEMHDKMAPSDMSSGLEIDHGHIIERTQQLHGWFGGLPRWWSGTVRIAHMREDIRIGERLSYDGREYYIESVTHTGNVGEEGSIVGDTVLAINRGRLVGDYPTLPPPWTR